MSAQIYRTEICKLSLKLKFVEDLSTVLHLQSSRPIRHHFKASVQRINFSQK